MLFSDSSIITFSLDPFPHSYLFGFCAMFVLSFQKEYAVGGLGQILMCSFTAPDS